MNQNPHWKQLIWNWASIIFGNALYSLAVALFLEPAGLITGGATGIALAIGRSTGLSVSGLLFFINLAMLVWGWVVLGRAFALNTLASSVLSPAFLALFEGMANGRVLTEDIFLCTVFAGLGIGVALGIVIRSGASTGGLDIPPLVLNKWFKLPVSATMLAFDIMVLLMQAVFSPMPQVLYGIVMVLIHTVVMDKMLMMGASRTEVKIIVAVPVYIQRLVNRDFHFRLVIPAQIHQYLIFNAPGSIGCQLDIFLRIEGVDRLDQSDGANGDQILHPHTGVVKFFGYVDHQTQVMFDQDGFRLILVFRPQITYHLILLLTGQGRRQYLRATDIVDISFPVQQIRLPAHHFKLHFSRYCYL